MQLGPEGPYGNLRDLTTLECESKYEYESDCKLRSCGFGYDHLTQQPCPLRVSFVLVSSRKE